MISSEANTTISILVIDDDRREADNAVAFLQKSAIGANLQFVIQLPDEVKNTSAWVQLIDSIPASAVLLDHKLGEAGRVSYTGLELADSVRHIKPTLPLFILTKYANDEKLEENGFAVDDIMDKSRLRKNAHTYITRLFRSIGRYEEARTETSKRMRDLVAESLLRNLTEQETFELSQLRADIGMEVLSRQIDLGDETRKNLNTKKHILEQLNNLLTEED